jgi:predicted MFS family arabinose efflux permease
VADRWNRKRAMIASDLAGAALFALMALVEPVWAILSVALLTAAAAAPFRAGSSAAVPSIVGDESRIAHANGYLAVGQNLGITLGPAVGGALVGSIGAGPVFLLNAASFALSAVLVWSIHAPFQDDPVEPGEGVRESDARDRGVMAGFRVLWRDRVLKVGTIAWAVLIGGMGLVVVADRPIAAVFSAGSVGFGVMLALYGVGAVSGAWVATRMTAQTEPTGLVAGLAIAGFAGIGIWLAPVFAVVVACNLIWGIGDGVNRVARTGILQRRTPDVVRARVSAANETVAHLAMMVGFLLAGPSIAALGAQATYAIGGFAALAAAALCATVVAETKRGAIGGPTHADPSPPPWE